MNIAKKITLALRLNSAYKEVAHMEGLKAGIKSSEFWLTILSNVGVFVAALKGVIDDQTAGIIIAASTGIYTAARAAIKAAQEIKTIKTGTVVAVTSNPE